MLDFIYHMTFRLLSNLISGVKCYNFVNIYTCSFVMDIITFPENMLSILLHGVISLPEATSKIICNIYGPRRE